MIRRPPRSTLFPYTRSSDLTIKMRAISDRCRDGNDRTAGQSPHHTGQCAFHTGANNNDLGPCENRSEEHTSELQSLTNLVCRLLLEKKKQQHTNTYITNNHT